MVDIAKTEYNMAFRCFFVRIFKKIIYMFFKDIFINCNRLLQIFKYSRFLLTVIYYSYI